MTRFGFVIPTYNEAEAIGRTIESIALQRSLGGGLVSRDSYEIVIADTPGHDETPRAVAQAAARFDGLRCSVVSEPARSMVAARNAGIEALLDRKNPVDYIVSGDADTVLPADWLSAVEEKLQRGATIVSTAGFFETSLWHRCPTLTRCYIEEIGTVFFPQVITDEYVTVEDRPLFTTQLFRDFGRPVSDCAFVIESGTYRKLGGFRPEYYDAEGQEEIPAVGWPFMFRAELAGIDIAYVEEPAYETSARRMLHEPDALFSGSSYLGEIENFRSRNDDQYAWLDHFAPQLNMEVLRRYVVKNYILQQCITRPERVVQNRWVFGSVADELVTTVVAWRETRTQPGAREVFAFADELTDRFFDTVVHSLRRSVS
ncbi:glycosyltransferase [Streptomyces sp. MBT97]|uniref:glycosyltransferase n=1 Tax=Streptomyces sp. MBT97 TaxID=2800411 RepID=UPI00190A1835|nr:glycosyltransferase [Streptomyces sp. MBT97]MBK3631952.1 glycosyltransferase [Streptomyces sp. MBT97]